MFKKALLVFTILVSLIVFSHAAQATSYGEPDGFYWLYGTTKLSAKFTGIATVSVTLSDLSVFGSLFYFDPWGDFAFYLPLLSEEPLFGGTWYSTAPGKFAVEGDLDSLASMLTDYGAYAYVTNRSFTGQVNSDGSIKGKFTLGIYFEMEGYSGTITISGSYVGHPENQYFVSGMGLTKPRSDGKGSSQKVSLLAEYLAKFLKSVPVK